MIEFRILIYRRALEIVLLLNLNYGSLALLACLPQAFFTALSLVKSIV